MADETAYEHLRNQGISRREFHRLCGLLAAALGLGSPPLKVLGAPPLEEVVAAAWASSWGRSSTG